MKKKTILSISSLALGLWLLSSCQQEPALKELKLNLPASTAKYIDSKYQSIAFGGAFGGGGGSNVTVDNQTNDTGATLGRVLFYDPRLSVNNATSCASCHKQQYGFADNQAFSAGFQGQMTHRNTPGLVNEINKSVFFWDGRESSLEAQVLLPVKNHLEMGLVKDDVLPAKLQKVSYYPELFRQAFGTNEITKERIAKAMAQFIRAIASSTADKIMSADAIAGQQLFHSKYRCQSCHVGTNFGGASISNPYYPITKAPTSIANTANIGLDLNSVDQGIQALNGDKNQNGFFVIPSLRNLGLTAPYMHDGRFATLEQVIDHYSKGILPHPNLDPILIDQNFKANQVVVTTGDPVKMNISDTEKAQLVAYLHYLTDYTIATDTRFSSPFQ